MLWSSSSSSSSSLSCVVFLVVLLGWRRCGHVMRQAFWRWAGGGAAHLRSSAVKRQRDNETDFGAMVFLSSLDFAHTFLYCFFFTFFYHWNMRCSGFCCALLVRFLAGECALLVLFLCVAIPVVISAGEKPPDLPPEGSDTNFQRTKIQKKEWWNSTFSRLKKNQNTLWYKDKSWPCKFSEGRAREIEKIELAGSFPLLLSPPFYLPMSRSTGGRDMGR